LASLQGRNTVLGRLRNQGDYLLAAGVFGLLVVILVPLPPPILDLLLASSISLSLLLFLVTFYVKKPVDFSVFPTVLLVATVFRLALNIASTRLILLNGADGGGAAGRIIEAFGKVVVGGNYAVGFVVFVILVVINFVVITKGAGRVAEVGARFTLDAMPGKQMAIDAELNAGLIDEHTARSRRAEITREADFYGAMDGASKFIRGDAIAGIVITLVNAIGGAFIGVIQNGMPLEEALRNYTLLTIGDGLVGQVPALIVSTAAGMLVTRVQDDRAESLHHQLGTQLFQSPRVLALVAAALLGFALIPGLRVPFAVVGAVVGWLAWQLARTPSAQAAASAEELSVDAADARPEDLLPVEPLAIEVGLDLLYLVDDRQGGELLQRVQRIRNQFAQELGVVLPPIHLRDNLTLDGGEYVILLRGEEIGRGHLQARQHLALDPGNASGKPRGVNAVDPVFGLPAYWILDAELLNAQRLGYTVVDVPTVLTTHIVELMHQHAHELFDSVQLQAVLERVSADNPRLVDDLVPDPLSRQAVLRIFRNLIREGLSSRDAQTILEAIGDHVARTQDPDILTEFVRQRMSRHISRRFADEEGVLHYVALGADAEDAVLRGLQSGESGPPRLVLEPNTARALISRIQLLVEQWPGPGQAVVLCPPLARSTLRKVLERVLPRVVVLSSAELLPSLQLERVGTVTLKTQNALK